MKFRLQHTNKSVWNYTRFPFTKHSNENLIEIQIEFSYVQFLNFHVLCKTMRKYLQKKNIVLCESQRKRKSYFLHFPRFIWFIWLIPKYSLRFKNLPESQISSENMATSCKIKLVLKYAESKIFFERENLFSYKSLKKKL